MTNAGNAGSSRNVARIGIINVSDRAAAGVYEDLPGKAIVEAIDEYLLSSWLKEYRVIPDERDQISETIIELSDSKKCCLIITSGGTGPALRDVTPEATSDACEKMLPGFGELMRKVSLKYVPTAILSRQTAGVRGATLVINLPGRPRAIRQCLDAIFPAVPYCVDLIGGPHLEVNPRVVAAFRPGQSHSPSNTT